MRNRVDNTKETAMGGKSRLFGFVRRWRRPVYLLISVVVWIALWQYGARKLGKPVLLPYPADVWKALTRLVADKSFSKILLGSLGHIATGFGLALACGLVLAVICRFSAFVEMLLLPPMKLVKTVPVVSFIILLLLWVDPARISIVISFLIVLPVVYANVSRGIRETSPEMLEMAKVFDFSFLRKLRRLYIPNAVPYATAAVSTGLSLCWKAGIAAEIIGLSKDSIGRQLYDSKLYLDTPSLFAWTVVVIIVSVAMEWAVMIIFRAAAITLADPTLWHRPGRAVRTLLGIPVPADAVSAEEADESALEAAEVREAADSVGKYPPVSETRVPAGDASKSAERDEIVHLENVGKSFDGKPVFDGISLSLRRGDCLVITGPSGVGKTTLLKCMLGLARPDRGAVTYPGGKPRMAAVFQEDRLCEGLPAWKNVALARKGSTGAEEKKEILSLLAELGIEEGEYKAVKLFSGGMKRRTAWMRALWAGADLLILDEPFTGLDSARKDRIMQMLASVNDTCAVAIVTHNTSEIEKITANFKNAGELRIEPESVKMMSIDGTVRK